MMNSEKKINVADIAHIGMFAALIVICTWISIPTVVPFTLQTFAIFLCSAMMGLKKSIFTVITYILLGVIGLPVFAGFKSIAALSGPTGGYIVGFIFVAIIVGFASEKSTNWVTIFTSMVVALLVLYIFGTAWFVFSMKSYTFGQALAVCVYPFIIPDLLKIGLALILRWRLQKLGINFM